MNLLTIAGSDPSSGAGIQSDVKTFTNLGDYAFTVITSITSQNTTKFGKIEPVSKKMILSQLDSIFSDFKVDAIKIGMVYDKNIISALYSKLSKKRIPIILDPVIKSTTGGNLLKKDAIQSFKKYLVPLAYAITPNISEANLLVGGCINNKQSAFKSALKLKNLGARNVVITGGTFEKGKITDYILEDSKFYSISGNKINKINHGSGCSFSAALAVAIAHKKKFKDAVSFARNYAYESIKKSMKMGKGIPIVQVAKKQNNIEKELENAIEDFRNLKKIYKVIPECQTNFVFSNKKTRSINDILGVSGRIVKSGKEVVMAGSILYGGSKHVGSALLEFRKKFPKIRSAVNIRYDSKLITRFKKNNFIVESYDRSKEPLRIKRKESSSISWGIKKVMKKCSEPPDVIFHKGDYGKEPMIIIFGENPTKVLEKISKIL